MTIAMALHLVWWAAHGYCAPGMVSRYADAADVLQLSLTASMPETEYIWRTEQAMTLTDGSMRCLGWRG